MNWSLYPNFSEHEFRCSHCGECHMRDEFLEKLQRVRDQYGPMEVLSGWRCFYHPAEIRKSAPGSHAQGRAADIAVSNAFDRFRLIRIALAVGMQGIGVAGAFVHLDDGHDHAERPAAWRYT